MDTLIIKQLSCWKSYTLILFSAVMPRKTPGTGSTNEVFIVVPALPVGHSPKYVTMHTMHRLVIFSMLCPACD